MRKLSAIGASASVAVLMAIGTISPAIATEAPDLDQFSELNGFGELSTFSTLNEVVVDSDPANVRVITLPSSGWDLSIDVENNQIVAESNDGPVLSIDYDGPDDDGHRVGISPNTGCGPMEGQFWGVTTPLTYPILDPNLHEIENIWVVAGSGDNLWVLMSGGSYQILDPNAADKPLFMAARFAGNGGALSADLAGLYYILPSKDPGTDFTIETADSSAINRTITMSSPASVEYIDDVREIAVSDGAYGDFDITTMIDRLQIQVVSSPVLDVFELDLDHTLKDLGQEVVYMDIDFAVSPLLSAVTGTKPKPGDDEERKKQEAATAQRPM